MRGDNQEHTVFIADDDLFIRDVIKQGLAGLCSVVEVADGKNLIDTYIKCLPDIIFLDVHLPSINGLDLIPRIKQEDPGSFIVMLTSDSTADNVKKAIANGASGFISKPFNKKILLENFYRCPTIQFL